MFYFLYFFSLENDFTDTLTNTNINHNQYLINISVAEINANRNEFIQINPNLHAARLEYATSACRDASNRLVVYDAELFPNTQLNSVPQNEAEIELPSNTRLSTEAETNNENNNTAIRDMESQINDDIIGEIDNMIHENEDNTIPDSSNDTHPTGEDLTDNDIEDETTPVVNNQTANNPTDDYDEIFYNEIIDVVQNNSNEVIIFPKFESGGIVGDVWIDYVWLEVEVRGSNYVADDRDSTVGYNSLFIKQCESKSYNCIDGGQIYIPRNINSDFSRLPNKDKMLLKNLPIHMSNYLSQDVTEVVKNESLLGSIKELMGRIDSKFKLLLQFERLHDNDKARMELTFTHSVDEKATEPTFEAFWPSCTNADGSAATLHSSDCFMFINQSDRYYFFKNFYQHQFHPLKAIFEASSESVKKISPECKTRLVWCAESLVMMTMNSFYRGIIHQKASGLSHVFGKITVPLSKRTDLTEDDKAITKLDWGINVLLFPSPLIKLSKPDKAIEVAHSLSRAVSELKGKIDFPDIYVSVSRQMWTIVQQFSFGRELTEEVGWFEPPDWNALATLHTKKMESFFQNMFIILISAYHQHRTKLIKQAAKRRNWNNRNDTDNPMTIAPMCHYLVLQHPNKLFMTYQNSNDRSVSKEIRLADKQPITSVGKYISPNIFFSICTGLNLIYLIAFLF